MWCFSHHAAAYQRQFDILVILSRPMGKKKRQSNFSETGGVRIHLGRALGLERSTCTRHSRTWGQRNEQP